MKSEIVAQIIGQTSMPQCRSEIMLCRVNTSLEESKDLPKRKWWQL
jgi:hypothetical protein